MGSSIQPVRLFAFLTAAAGLLLTGPALAYEFATDDDAVPLHWEEDGPLGFTQAVIGGGGIPAWRLHAAARIAFDTWARTETTDLQFEERYVFGGPYCPHAIPEGDEALIQAVCGTSLPDHDFRSALFFIETVWPFGAEVIALTTLSWADGARLVDADIAYNGLDYTWSVADDDVRVDFESINVHEIGHFLGLAHSDVPGAVMRVDYDEGDLVRELGADDIDGVAELYPCSSPPCRGAVSHVSPKSCSSADAVTRGGATLVVGLLLCGVLFDRRRRAVGVVLSLVVGLAILPTPATSSTVLALSVDDLLDRSERVAHARVLSVEPRRQGAIVRSRIDLEILEDWRGVGEAHVVLDQPGGVVPGLGTHVFGMPRFVEGAEVVVFLSDDAPIGTRVVGLDQGKFDVRPDGTLVRDQSGLMLARVGDGPPVPLLAPDTLSELRAASLKADPR